ncbi:Uncharacterised protein [Chlamydia trachomatis]|nr:Uncharacterised protein [Chlamydia trachomatis]
MLDKVFQGRLAALLKKLKYYQNQQRSDSLLYREVSVSSHKPHSPLFHPKPWQKDHKPSLSVTQERHLIQ